jgi:hypothetical protein
MKSSHTLTPSHQYLVEMTFPPFASILTPQEIVGFMERMVLPTLEACQKLCDTGRIVGGGPTLAATGFAFIARADSPQELEEMVTGLPLWPRAQTRVVPLGAFEWRASAARERLRDVKTRIPATAPSTLNPV